MNCFKDNEEYLIETLKNDHLQPPSDKPYNFTSSIDHVDNLIGQFGQPIYLDSVIFKGQVENGFFIEAGADDFEYESNTLFFEMKYGWTGLLVEPNPIIYPKGLTCNRKAWASSSCLATKNHPHFVQFAQRLNEGKKQK